MTTRSPPTAASWSADSLLPCPFCGNPAERTQRDNEHSIIYKVECTHCYASVTDDEAAMYADAAWNRRATPPAQSARPNEATLQAACAAYTVALSRYGSNLQRESAHEVGMRAALRAANEADVPRGQAVAWQWRYRLWNNLGWSEWVTLPVGDGSPRNPEWEYRGLYVMQTTDPVCWIDGADIGFMRDGVKSSAHISPHQELPCMVPLYLAPLPSPVGEADGVREKYRAMTLESIALYAEIGLLQARVEAAAKLIEKWQSVQNSTPAPVYQVYGFCADDLERALAPLTSGDLPKAAG